MKARVVLRHTADGNRRPTGIRAIIEDPGDLACATYANDVGEMYFTIPLNHPQAGECEPFKTHWEVQRWTGTAWVELHEYAYGLLTDLDFAPDEVIVYGMDYLGLLSLSIDTRTPEEKPDGTYKNFNKSTRDGGAKYKREKISYILKEQLDLAQAEEESLTGFIHRGQVDEMDTEISIYVSYRQRLDFIRGLLDSYRQGTGIGSRLSVSYDDTDARWEWRIDADPGVERPAFRFEYGGLVQGFRILTYPDFATRAMGVGVVLNSTKPIYRMFPNEGDADSYVAQYGNMQVANVWQDLSDRNDLKRRVRQLYAERSRIGKKVALGLRVHQLLPFQRYDLSDHVILDIERYALDTSAFGSGWWTIWGTEWRLYRDGHDELTLVVRPREDTKPADPDILDSDPVVDNPNLCFGEGPPPAGEECDCDDGYVDVLTGTVYLCHDGEPQPPINKPWEPIYQSFDDFERVIVPVTDIVTVPAVGSVTPPVAYELGDIVYILNVYLADEGDGPPYDTHHLVVTDPPMLNAISFTMPVAGRQQAQLRFREINGAEPASWTIGASGGTPSGEESWIWHVVKAAASLSRTSQSSGFSFRTGGVPFAIGNKDLTWADESLLLMVCLTTTRPTTPTTTDVTEATVADGTFVATTQAGVGDEEIWGALVHGPIKAEDPMTFPAWTPEDDTYASAASMVIRVGGSYPSGPGYDTPLTTPPGIGENLPNGSVWEARLWEALGYVVGFWHIEDGWLTLNGSADDTAAEHGKSYSPTGDLVIDAPAGPYDVPHIVRIPFKLTGVGAGLTGLGVGFEYVWKSAKWEDQHGAATVGVAIRFGDVFVVVVDGVDYPVPELGMVSGGEYVLEVDLFSGVKVRIAPTVEELDDALHVYDSLTIAEGADQSELAVHGWAATGTAHVAIGEISILMGPSSGETFKGFFVAYGDSVTVTFTGLPTKDGAEVSWSVDGIPVEPASYDAETGEVTFDRPIAWLGRVLQTGVRR